MWRRKKLIFGVVLAAVILFGSLGAVALADNGDGGPAAKHGEFIDKVCEIYEENTGDAIDADELQKAIAEAQSEMQAAAMEARLAKMVENGVIDEDQAKALEDWWESMPEDMPFGPGLRSPCGFHGMGGMRSFPGMFRPLAPAE